MERLDFRVDFGRIGRGHNDVGVLLEEELRDGVAYAGGAAYDEYTGAGELGGVFVLRCHVAAGL